MDGPRQGGRRGRTPGAAQAVRGRGPDCRPRTAAPRLAVRVRVDPQATGGPPVAMRPQPAPVGGRSRSADLGTTPPEGLSFLYRSDLPAFQSTSDPVSSSLGDASFDLLLAEFTGRWERGEAPRA